MEAQTPTGPTYPVQLSVDYPDRTLNRLTTAFRIFTAIPILIVAALLSGQAMATPVGSTQVVLVTTGGLLFLPALLMILFRQKYPRWWFDWNLELRRFSNRVGVYIALMDDRYPSTREQSSTSISYPDAPARAEPLDAAGEVVSRDSALHRADLPQHRAFFASSSPGSPSCLPAAIRGACSNSSKASCAGATASWRTHSCTLVTDEYPPFSLNP